MISIMNQCTLTHLCPINWRSTKDEKEQLAQDNSEWKSYARFNYDDTKKIYAYHNVVPKDDNNSLKSVTMNDREKFARKYIWEAHQAQP